MAWSIGRVAVGRRAGRPHVATPRHGHRDGRHQHRRGRQRQDEALPSPRRLLRRPFSLDGRRHARPRRRWRLHRRQPPRGAAHDQQLLGQARARRARGQVGLELVARRAVERAVHQVADQGFVLLTTHRKISRSAQNRQSLSTRHIALSTSHPALALQRTPASSSAPCAPATSRCPRQSPAAGPPPRGRSLPRRAARTPPDTRAAAARWRARDPAARPSVARLSPRGGRLSSSSSLASSSLCCRLRR